MISFVRKVVAGPKHKTLYGDQELDLTYITDRIIAMAFPASDIIQKTYRNSIDDVAAYLKEKHGNSFMIVNVSSRKYDHGLFEGRVKDYQWPDHQAPPLSTLILIAYSIMIFLSQSKQNVVAVHCNHGKGRTGTAIIAFMLFVQYFKSAEEALQFYNKKRFNELTYGVDQPCQRRYLGFVQKLMSLPLPLNKIVCYRLQKITHQGLGDNYFVEIQYTRNQQTVLKEIPFDQEIKHSNNQFILLADIFIQIFHISWKGKRKIARINYNLQFLQNHLSITWKGANLKLSDHSPDFEITLHFQYFCLCHLPTYKESVCRCYKERIIQQKYWGEVQYALTAAKRLSQKEISDLFNRSKNVKNQYRVKKNMQKLNERVQIPQKSKSESKSFKNKTQERIYEKIQHANKQRLSCEDNKLEQVSKLSGQFEQQTFDEGLIIKIIPPENENKTQ